MAEHRKRKRKDKMRDSKSLDKARSNPDYRHRGKGSQKKKGGEKFSWT